MSELLIKFVEQEYKDVRSKFPSFKAGDTINVHVKITEGAKERVQQFQGTVPKKKYQYKWRNFYRKENFEWYWCRKNIPNYFSKHRKNRSIERR